MCQNPQHSCRQEFCSLAEFFFSIVLFFLLITTLSTKMLNYPSIVTLELYWHFSKPNRCFWVFSKWWSCLWVWAFSLFHISFGQEDFSFSESSWAITSSAWVEFFIIIVGKSFGEAILRGKKYGHWYKNKHLLFYDKKRIILVQIIQLYFKKTNIHFKTLLLIIYSLVIWH